MFTNKTIKPLIILFFGGLLMYACLEPFEPSLSANELNILIVDGYINAGPGKTKVILSNVSPLNQSGIVLYEENAEVSIETDNNESFPLAETSGGIYQSEDLNLPTDKKYRLHIKLKNGKEYRSALMSVKITPPIDTIAWESKPDLLYIYAYAHDQQQATRYYSWSFEEDWEIRVKYPAYLRYNGDTIILRLVTGPPGTDNVVDMSICYKSGKSKIMNFASTQLQVSDSIKHAVRTFAHSAEQTQVRYSMLLHQHTLTEEEFNYLTLVEKNSTQVGSFFDPMPSQLYGNIQRTTNADETVVGYVGVYTTVSKRLFLHGDSLPPTPIQDHCESVDFLNTPENLESYLGGQLPAFIPYQMQYQGNPPSPMVTAFPRGCMDCRSNSTVPRPDYWADFFRDP